MKLRGESTASSTAALLDRCLQRGVEYLLALQSTEGYWWAELESNVTMASEYLLLEHFLGIGEQRRWQKICRYLLDHQQADGSWPTYFGGAGDVSITTEAYFALKLAGLDPERPEMVRARTYVRAHGGVRETRIFTKLWLALFGQFDWEALPAMPPETILLPSSFPFNIYEFASWARATFVAILVVWAHKPVHPIPNSASVDELYLRPEDRHHIRFRPDPAMFTWRNAFLLVDRLLKAHERLPHKPLRARALAACEAWIVEHQEGDGSWGGIQPPWVYSLIALKCRGYGNDHPVMQKAIHGLLHDFALETETTFTLQPCLSPVWDTALAVIGLREAGVPADDPALLRAGRWLLSKENRGSGDWCAKVKNIEPGGWPFEFVNDKYADTDDTAEVMLALRLLDLAPKRSAAFARARRWLRAMQSRNGGWGAFDKDNTRALVTKIPFADFGATLDPPTVDVTAHIVEMFGLDGADPQDPMMKRAVRYLWSEQEEDGSWFGRWGVNYVYGLGAALPALAAAGESTDQRGMHRAVRWLVEHQNEDGGWGESCASYENAVSAGRGVSTASQTAWALLGLLAAGEVGNEAVERGVAYLISTQQPEGAWEEAQFTGTGFPGDFMLKYHMYRIYWPLWALGRYRRIKQGRTIHERGSEPLA